VWDLERAVHLPGEGAVQSLLLRGDTLAHLANTYYATVHFPATAASWSGSICDVRPTTSGPAGCRPRSPPPHWCCISRSRSPRRACWP
jgi:hypothetical protein